LPYKNVQKVPRTDKRVPFPSWLSIQNVPQTAAPKFFHALCPSFFPQECSADAMCVILTS
jgi:hypothetical protein